MTNTQLFILSIQTCQWWNAVFIQAKRFMDDLKHNDGGTPWDEKNENKTIFKYASGSFDGHRHIPFGDLC